MQHTLVIDDPVVGIWHRNPHILINRVSQWIVEG